MEGPCKADKQAMGSSSPVYDSLEAPAAEAAEGGSAAAVMSLLTVPSLPGLLLLLLALACIVVEQLRARNSHNKLTGSHTQGLNVPSLTMCLQRRVCAPPTIDVPVCN